jgi:hypothetical protein
MPADAPGLLRRLFRLLRPVAGLVLVLMFWMPVVAGGATFRAGGAADGNIARLFWAICCILLTAGVVLGFWQRTRRPALWAMTGFFFALDAYGVWAAVTWGWFAPPFGMTTTGLLLSLGWSLIDSWAEERAQRAPGNGEGATDRGLPR